MSRCISICRPYGCVLEIPPEKNIAGKPYLNGIVSHMFGTVCGCCYLVLAGLVWVQRADLIEIEQKGIKFVVVEDGDELFEKKVFGEYRYNGIHQSKNAPDDMVAISLDGSDITETIKMRK